MGKNSKMGPRAEENFEKRGLERTKSSTEMRPKKWTPSTLSNG